MRILIPVVIPEVVIGEHYLFCDENGILKDVVATLLDKYKVGIVDKISNELYICIDDERSYDYLREHLFIYRVV